MKTQKWIDTVLIKWYSVRATEKLRIDRGAVCRVLFASKVLGYPVKGKGQSAEVYQPPGQNTLGRQEYNPAYCHICGVLSFRCLFVP